MKMQDLKEFERTQICLNVHIHRYIVQEDIMILIYLFCVCLSHIFLLVSNADATCNIILNFVFDICVSQINAYISNILCNRDLEFFYNVRLKDISQKSSCLNYFVLGVVKHNCQYTCGIM